MIDHNPTKALELIAYQAIISSTSRLYPLHAWLNDGKQFCITAASDPPCDGTHVTQTNGVHAPLLFLQSFNLAGTHAPIVARLVPTERISIFTTQLHNLLFSDQWLDQPSARTPTPQYARTSTTLCVPHNPACTYLHICNLCHGNHPCRACPNNRFKHQATSLDSITTTHTRVGTK